MAGPAGFQKFITIVSLVTFISDSIAYGDAATRSGSGLEPFPLPRQWPSNASAGAFF
jgi:hypothetical protein